MKAITLYSKKASADLDDKIKHSLKILQNAFEIYSKNNKNNVDNQKDNLHHYKIAQASSLGAEDVVVTQLLHQANLLSQTDVFVLNTGKLHAETLNLIPQIEARYQHKISIYEPNEHAANAFEYQNGEDAMYKSIDLRKSCCHIRKMQPLAEALRGKSAWITGLRREQSNDRAEIPEIDTSGNLPKINPIVNWTQGDVWRFIENNQLPYNLLHDQFYPSIGCAPCTRSVTLGEDIRSGRWWWENENAKECGLHVASSIIQKK